jgi:formate/nitrite transporter
MFGGCYIGMGGMLSLTVSGNCPGIALSNPGIQTFIYAILFPVNLVIIINTGGVLFTGATFTAPCAVLEGKSTLLDCARVIWWSWAGNLVGGIAFAIFCDWCGLLELDGGAAKLALAYTYKKVVPRTLLQNFLRGIGCNWLVCIAVYLCTMAQDFTGKYIAIVLPISAFVAIGFEHMPANAFLLPAGFIASLKLEDMFYSGRHKPSAKDIFVKNILMSTLGNWMAGTFIMSLNYSFSFGRLKQHPAFSRWSGRKNILSSNFKNS